MKLEGCRFEASEHKRWPRAHLVVVSIYLFLFLLNVYFMQVHVL